MGVKQTRENVEDVHHGILFVIKGNGDFEIFRKMNGIWKYNAE